MSFKCIYCHQDLETNVSEAIQCHSCENTFLVVDGTPIFLVDPLGFLNENYASIQHHIASTKAYVRTFESSFYLRPDRLPYFKQLQDGYLNNLAIYQRLASELVKFTSSQLIANVNYAAFANDPIKGKEINYFIRDWGGLSSSENEINVLTTLLKKRISEFAQGASSIFFAGSGTGRFAYELATDFDHVFCTDLSFRMVKLFDYIIKNEHFKLEILSGFSNIYDPKDVTKKVNVYKRNPANPTNISNFISDIRTIPLRDESLDVFSSIYFLDVLNIEYYVKEINRVLKTGGIYINIGPIGYPGANFVHNLLPTEIKSVFENAGFTIVSETFEDNSYMKFDHEMSTIIHTNWVLVARKNEIEQSNQIKESSILQLSETVFTERRSSLSTEGENVFYNRIYYTGGDTYEDADLFIEILYRIDGVNTLEQVIDLIDEELGIKLVFDDLVPHIQRFIDNNTLKIIQVK